MTLEQRVIILPPTPRDGELTWSMLRVAGIEASRCDTVAAVCSELDRGAAALLVAEEALAGEEIETLAEWVHQQPPWSDFPVVLLARHGADSAAVAGATARLGNVTVVERPIRVAALVSIIGTALRARQRQYQIREHLIERARAEAALRASDRRKDEFLAMLAHELRNPLAPIRNSLHILSLTASSDTTVPQVTEMMERQVNHLVRLVDDLLEVSRISQGKITLKKELVDLSGVVRTAVEASRPLIDAGRHHLTIAIPHEPLSLEADPVRIAQVLENLLNNAARYTRSGGEIWLTVTAEPGSIRISVRDTGSGIASEMLPHVFDMFIQVDHGNRNGGGLGIGLTLVKSLVELHGGQVEARSEGRGKGSEFVVTLPRVPMEGTTFPEAPLPPRLTRQLPAVRVLVVDDNRDAADSLAFLLGTLGCETAVAYSGEEALRVLHQHRPTVVLLDIGMPEMDGHEVARRIRKEPGFERVTLIALTGWGQQEDVARSREAGFDHHLIKPADVAALETLILSL
jgi:signal transduction histidine kinase/CheY-like chemotaxis protein